MPSAERNTLKSISVFFECFVEYRWWPSYHATEDSSGPALVLRGWVWPLQKAHQYVSVLKTFAARSADRHTPYDTWSHLSPPDEMWSPNHRKKVAVSWIGQKWMHFGFEQSSRVIVYLPAIITSPPASTGRRALRPLEDYAIKLFRRMASILAMQIGI